VNVPATTARRTSAGRPRGASRQTILRRRVTLILGVLGVAGLLTAILMPTLDHAVQEITLPLRHEDIIRQQSALKKLDPALVAGVIYAESHFRDQTSHAGAKGLMQITPQTAQFIAHRSGGTAFELEDLSTPQVNISYGTYYLRYLIDRYGGNVALALAAYNGGEGNVDRWIGQAGAADRSLRVEDIPFPETRAYVRRVLRARVDYARKYPRELGLR
jgi:soluble lytic murein transglycosylase